MRFAMSSRLRFEFLEVGVALRFDWLGPVGSEVVVSAGVRSVAFAAGRSGVACGVELKLEPEVCDCGANPRPGISRSNPDPLSGSPPTSARADDTVREAVDGANAG
jgi:hypothetical protein